MNFEILRCPVCNRGYTGQFWGKIASLRRECLGFLFGNRGGRGHGFYVVKELNLKQEVPSKTFFLIKKRLKEANRLWLQRGWLSFGELNDVVKEVEREEAYPWLLVKTEKRPGFKPLRKEHEGISIARSSQAPVRKSFDFIKEV